MKTIEELRKALLVAKESIEENLEELNSITDEEEEPVTLRIQYGETKWEEEITIPQADLCDLQINSLYMRDPEEHWVVSTRTEGPLAGKAFLLNEEYDWELGRDDDSRLCLVPIKK